MDADELNALRVEKDERDRYTSRATLPGVKRCDIDIDNARNAARPARDDLERAA